MVLISNIGSKIISFLTLGVLSRFLNTESFGNFSAIQNSANSGNMIGSLGIPVVLQIKTANIEEANKEEVNAIISNSIITYLLANGAVCLILLLFPYIFTQYLLNSNLDSSYNFHLVLLILLMAVNQIPLYVLIGFGEFKEYALRNVAFNLITLIITVIFLYIFGKTLTSALAALYMSNLVTIGLTMMIFRNIVIKYNLHLKFIPDVRYIKMIISSGFIYYIGNTFLVAISGLVTISVFYKYLSPDEYGYLRIATAISVILSIIPSAIQPVNLSKIFLDGDQKRLKSVQIRIIPFITIFIFLLISSNLFLLISILFGPNYTSGTEFIYYIILLQIPAIYLGIFSNFITASGALNFIGFVAVIGTFTLMISLTILTPIFKIDAYIYSSFITTFLSLLLVVLKELKSNNYIHKLEAISFLINILILSLNLIFIYYFPTFGILIALLLITTYSLLSYNFCFTDDEKIKLKNNLWLKLSPLLKK